MKIFLRVSVSILLIIISLSPVYSKKTTPPASEMVNSVPYPRIANCYNAQLAWIDDERLKSYLAKLDLIIGVGGYDFHYDTENPEVLSNYARVEQTIAKLKSIKPTILILPYVDVIEGPLTQNVPEDFWLRDSQGKLVSTWPGYYRINTDRREALDYCYQQTKKIILNKPIFDGVFYDCWRPDPFLTKKTVQEFPKSIVMVNPWNLPSSGYETINGALSEDELNRVLDGTIEYDDFLTRYINWTKKSRKPQVTTIVCHPRTMNDDPWRWANLSDAKRQAEMDAARDSDNQVIRLGLASSMMGDGYFAYDAGTMSRGNWWWYPEYDAKVGQPLADAQKQPDGSWRREFEGGTVIANGTSYDLPIHFDRLMEDVSTGRVSREFTLPMQDGRIYRPTSQPETTKSDSPLGFTALPPVKLLTKTLPNGELRFQLPSGIEAFIEASGMLRALYYQGTCVALGGKTVVVNPPWNEFKAIGPKTKVTPDYENDSVIIDATGSLVEGDSRLEYSSRISLGPEPVVLIDMRYIAQSDLNLQMWRHYFAFPVSIYQGAMARQGDSSARLPKSFLGEEILKWGQDQLVIDNKRIRILADSSIGMSLADLRKYGDPSYLWAGYPEKLQFKKGATWEVQLKIKVAGK